jgi:hypothetical protein
MMENPTQDCCGCQNRPTDSKTTRPNTPEIDRLVVARSVVVAVGVLKCILLWYMIAALSQCGENERKEPQTQGEKDRVRASVVASRVTRAMGFRSERGHSQVEACQSTITLEHWQQPGDNR